MRNAICDAIANRAVLDVDYGGGSRRIEPHCHGTSTAGNEVVRVWQVRGYSRSGEPVGWKLFLVADFGDMSPSGETFQGPRPEYNPNDRGMIRVHCCV